MSHTVWMTQAAQEKARQELADLTKLGTASDPAVAVRVAQLKELLSHADSERKPDDGLVEPGMRVAVRFDSDGSTQEFVLASRAIMALDEVDVPVFSPESPLGSAIDGKYVGDSAVVDAPHGPRTLRIMSAVPFP